MARCARSSGFRTVAIVLVAFALGDPRRDGVVGIVDRVTPDDPGPPARSVERAARTISAARRAGRDLRQGWSGLHRREARRGPHLRRRRSGPGDRRDRSRHVPRRRPAGTSSTAMRDATSCSGVALETTPGAAPAGTASSEASAATSACNAIDGHFGDRCSEDPGSTSATWTPATTLDLGRAQSPTTGASAGEPERSERRPDEEEPVTGIEIRRFEQADETRTFEHGSFELVTIGGVTIGQGELRARLGVVRARRQARRRGAVPGRSTSGSSCRDAPR